MCLAGKTALASGKGKGGVTRIMTVKGEMSAKDCEKRIWGARVVPTLARGAEEEAGTMKAGESIAAGVGAALEAEVERGGGKGMTKGEEG